MVTYVGSEIKIIDAIKSLIELEYDALEAYKAAIAGIENLIYKSQLREFCEDHERHIKELSFIMSERTLTPPSGPDLKQYLTKGKVFIGKLMGDQMVLKAMLSNEMDTNEAYDNMLEREDVSSDIRDVLLRGQQDERKHKTWLESIINQ